MTTRNIIFLFKKVFKENKEPATIFCSKINNLHLKELKKLKFPIVSLVGKTPLIESSNKCYEYGFVSDNQLICNLPKNIAKKIVILDPDFKLGLRISLKLLINGARKIEHNQTSLPIEKIIITCFLEKLSQFYFAHPISSVIASAICMKSIFHVLRAKQVATKTNTICFAIGSLAPGGSEHQLSMLLTQLAKKEGNKKLLVEHPLKGRHSFFYPNIKKAKIKVFILNKVKISPSNKEHKMLIRLSKLGAWLGVDQVRLLKYFCYFSFNRPKIVHLWLDDVNTVAGLAALAAGVPKIILNCRSLAPYNFQLDRPYFKKIYKILLKSPRVYMLNNSRAGAGNYAKWCGIHEKRIIVVPNGFLFTKKVIRVQPGKQKSHNTEPQKRILIGSVMRLSEEKRPLLWLEIARECYRKNQNARFVIYGEGPMRRQMEAVIQEGKLQKVIQLPGVVPGVASKIRKMDLLLLTSSAEGLPNVLIEAQALGVPVAAFDVGGVSECVQDGITGHLLPDANPAKVADCLETLADDLCWRNHASRSAPAFVRSKFSILKMTEKIESIHQH